MTVLRHVPSPASRSRSARRALVGLLLLATAACSGGGGGGKDDQVVHELQVKAALAPCQAGLANDFPSLTARCLGGGPAVQVKGSLGRPHLVNAWGEWCQPCRAEMADLVAYEKTPGAVPMYGVLTETDGPKVALEYITEQGRMPWSSVRDDQGVIAHRYGGGPPITFAVDASGVIRDKHLGQFHSVADVQAFVASAYRK